MKQRLRSHPGYWAFLGHRLSGLALAVFLPFHFLLLGQALQGEAAMDGLLRFSDLPLVKLAEWGLVSLFALHLFFGLRVLLLELLPWRRLGGPLTPAIFAGAAGALGIGIVFLIGVV